jgi:hypothetical protein
MVAEVFRRGRSTKAPCASDISSDIASALTANNGKPWMTAEGVLPNQVALMEVIS